MTQLHRMVTFTWQLLTTVSLWHFLGFYFCDFNCRSVETGEEYPGPMLYLTRNPFLDGPWGRYLIKQPFYITPWVKYLVEQTFFISPKFGTSRSTLFRSHKLISYWLHWTLQSWQTWDSLFRITGHAVCILGSTHSRHLQFYSLQVFTA